MIKINIFGIVQAHFRSVFTGGWYSTLWDVIIFLLTPLLCSVFFFMSDLAVGVALRELLVTVFSIFSALLFSAQIGLFGLKRRTDYDNLPKIEADARLSKDKGFNEFLRSFSANTSYLILLSAFALLCFVVEYMIDPTSEEVGLYSLVDAVITFISVHFFLSLLMILKRFFVAYEASY